MTGIYDSFNRPISYPHISITDRCNLCCIYRMFEDVGSLVYRGDILTYEEIYKVVQSAVEFGITKTRINKGDYIWGRSCANCGSNSKFK